MVGGHAERGGGRAGECAVSWRPCARPRLGQGRSFEVQARVVCARAPALPPGALSAWRATVTACGSCDAVSDTSPSVQGVWPFELDSVSVVKGMWFHKTWEPEGLGSVLSVETTPSISDLAFQHQSGALCNSAHFLKNCHFKLTPVALRFPYR